MDEIEKARMMKRVIRMICIAIITVASNSLWGTEAAWIAFAVAMLIVVGLTGIEQEVRRLSDALIRAEKRVTGGRDG
jgi:hypothetical protein